VKIHTDREQKQCQGDTEKLQGPTSPDLRSLEGHMIVAKVDAFFGRKGQSGPVGQRHIHRTGAIGPIRRFKTCHLPETAHLGVQTRLGAQLPHLDLVPGVKSTEPAYLTDALGQACRNEDLPHQQLVPLLGRTDGKRSHQRAFRRSRRRDKIATRVGEKCIQRPTFL